MTSRSTSHEIDYAHFGAWYDDYRADILEPALEAAAASLDLALADLLSERDRERIRTVSGRVKSKRRTWRKINQPRYADRVATVDDIPRVIDDLIGLRLTCINVRDIEMIQTALDALPRVEGPRLWLDEASERDYVSTPKESGYRGWHVNLGIAVDNLPLVCELQVRTLLQDSWGELTHADTYSKDGALPPLVDVLSTRMADLLSILDDIAEDLRTELDRIDQAVVAEHDDRHDLAEEGLAGQAADAALMLQTRWASMDRPTELAALAWALQKEFGAEVSDDWFGHGSFKRFLRHAVPEGEISTGRQAYLLPADDGANDADASPPQPEGSEEPEIDGSSAPHAPGAARQLKRIDPEFPLLDGAKWPVVFEHLAEAWRRRPPTTPDSATVNRVTRSATDMARAAGTPLSRRNFHYVVEALLTSMHERSDRHDSNPGPSSLAEAFAGLIIQRMIELRIISDTASKAASRVDRWITTNVPQPASNR